jgi:hypothetical protein
MWGCDLKPSLAATPKCATILPQPAVVKGHRRQRPWEKPNHALVLGGPPGIGKDTALEPIKRAIGTKNFVEISPQHLLGQFNGFVKSVILRMRKWPTRSTSLRTRPPSPFPCSLALQIEERAVGLWNKPRKYSILAQSTLKTRSFLGKILMGRPKGAKNKLTILREAHKARIDALREPEIIDSLHVLERSMRHFFIRAEMGMNAGRNQSEVDADYEKAAHLAALVAPYRHARLSAMKLAGDPNNPVQFKDDATADEVLADIMRRIGELAEAGVIDLAALPSPKRRMTN